MPTIIDRLLGRTPTAEKAIVTGNGGTGPGVVAWNNDTPLWRANRNPRKLMRQAQELYHNHAWVHAAEQRVSSAAAGLPWHLEDEDGDEVTDESKPELKAIRDLLEKPQAMIPPGIKKLTRRSLWQITFRHEGLCGNAFWYLDQQSGLGAPAAFLYINPVRMWAVYDRVGNTLGWRLDADDNGDGGVPIELNEVVQFEYDPPDSGAYGIGIVESAGLKAQLSALTDRQSAQVLASGGRLTGIITPKDNTSTVTPEEWDKFVRDYRNITEDPDAAKRLQIVKQPIEYIRTTATPQELQIVDLSKLGRDDVTSLWGVPLSQLGVEQPAGLNSGETKSYDEAILYQGAVHSRVVPFRETVQYQILDLIAASGGPRTELVIDEPEFDDETPLYERALKAVDQPLMENERRAILGLDPLPDFDVEGQPLGLAIYRPSTLTLIGRGPADGETFPDKPAPPKPEPVPPPTPFGTTEPPEMVGKARTAPLQGLRRSLETKWRPAIEKAIAAVLSEQAKSVAAKIRAHGDKIAKKPKDWGIWWSPEVVNRQLERALIPHAVGIAEQVSTQANRTLGAKKADTFSETVANLVRKSVGSRITKINETTRDDVARIIGEGFDRGLSPGEVAALIEEGTPFNAARAELIARTESALAYNESALRSYEEFGFSEVQAIDGDQDPECAERDGQVFSLDEAMAIEDHPNGTLDWAPIKAVEHITIRRDEQGRVIGLSR